MKTTKRLKRPRDPIQLGKLIVDSARLRMRIGMPLQDAREKLEDTG